MQSSDTYEVRPECLLSVGKFVRELTVSSDTAVVRFAVMPLSHTAGECQQHDVVMLTSDIPALYHRAGLVSWYQRGDTLQAICRQQRKVTGVPMDLELKLIGQHAPGMTKGTLTSMQAVEAFELALDATKGDELAAVLWKKSESAASWLERRAAYARSLATTSMVGHLLGLGEYATIFWLGVVRTALIPVYLAAGTLPMFYKTVSAAKLVSSSMTLHASRTLALLTVNWGNAAVQIDFGDCFEQAMERDSFPEVRRLSYLLTCVERALTSLPSTAHAFPLDSPDD